MKSKKLARTDSGELLKDPKWIKRITKRDSFAAETAQVLFDARVRMGLTQGALAKKIGTTQSVIARNESGRTLPGLSFIQRLAKAYRTHARIVFESMPEVVPIAVKYAYLTSKEHEKNNATSMKFDIIDALNATHDSKTEAGRTELMFANS